MNLAVFLDAEFYRDRVVATEIIDSLHAEGRIGRTLFAFVSHESVASRWRECECHPPFARFIDDEFFPWIESLHPSVRMAQERVIVGLSYTGLAAAYVAMMAPQRFTRVIAQSGSFWWNDCWLAGRVAAEGAKTKAEFYLDVGKRESQENVRHKEDVLQEVSQIEGVRRFRDALQVHGCNPKYVEFDGGHDFACWRLTLPGALKWALPAEV